MKNLIIAFVLTPVVLGLSGCLASATSPVGVSCSPGVAWQDKNPDCTGGG